MRKSVKEKWVKALRSGKYKQGKGYLKNKDRFCCLGVLCDIYKQEYPSSKWEDYDAVNRIVQAFHIKVKTNGKYWEDFDHCSLPDKIVEWAKLDSCEADGDFTTKSGRSYSSLVEANDSGCKFTTIADLIEENL